MNKQEIKHIKVEHLNLWSENPRDPIDVNLSDFEIIERAINDDKKWNLQKLILDMGSYYDLSELPTVVLKDGKFIVYDGNRRIAILKYLQNEKEYLEQGIKLKYKNVDELVSLKEIPCNLCESSIALNNIERKHIDDGTWKPLERDYFLHIHRGQQKSDFLWFEEQTGLISQNHHLNQRFVKEEVLNNDNLKAIGFKFEPNKGFISNYTEEQSSTIFKEIDKAITSKKISTRKNRGKLLEPLLENEPKLKDFVAPYDKNKKSYPLKAHVVKENDEASKTPRKTPITKPIDLLFGGTLELKKGKVNDLYRAIVLIYDNHRKDKTVLPIIGMSLRLLLEVAARVHYNDDPEISKSDQIYKKFLKQAGTDMILEQNEINFFSLTKSWLAKNSDIEGLLGKFAHGNLLTIENDILESSKVIADIIKFYFSK
ncbi:hypothetical protein [Flavobacterium eburneipallidum]|uniref:hypothetical protein n=1 Tax=Flavobacterium eburneipallidum TaxID=3003263 RepID=UPI00248237FB|nr:hypothetical protein [Flavobacterium eburneipallidum]